MSSDEARDSKSCHGQGPSCSSSTSSQECTSERHGFKGSSHGSSLKKGKQRYYMNKKKYNTFSDSSRRDKCVKYKGKTKQRNDVLEQKTKIHQAAADGHSNCEEDPEMRKDRSKHRHHRSRGNVDMEVTFGGQKRKRTRHDVRETKCTSSGHSSGGVGSTDGTTIAVTEGETKHTMTRVRKIPGFYYDHEKKRYFKILPGHSNPHDFVTSEAIKAKEAERTRIDLLNETTTSARVTGDGLSALDILHSMQQGNLKHGQYTRYSTACRIRAMSTKPSTVYEPSTDLHLTGRPPVIKFVELDRSRTKVMVVLSSDHVSRIILGSISGERGTKMELQLQEWQDVYVRNSTSSQISSAQLINIDQQDVSFPGNLYVLFSWLGDYSNAVQLVKCPSEHDPASYVGYRFESPGEIIRSCSWSSNPLLPAHLCIGFNQEAEIIDILSNCRQRLDTWNKAVWSQVFAKKQPVIHLGLKHGCISTYDLRTQCEPVHLLTTTTKRTSWFNHGRCVCSLRLLQDENYLLAGCTSGTIKLWDLRQKAIVQELCGHHNEYKPLSVSVEQTESFVYAVGQDKHTRIWSMKDGHLLKTIALPLNIKDSSIPSATFSLDWGGSALPGMMIGATNKLFWYPF